MTSFFIETKYSNVINDELMSFRLYLVVFSYLDVIKPLAYPLIGVFFPNKSSKFTENELTCDS